MVEVSGKNVTERTAVAVGHKLEMLSGHSADCARLPD